MKKTALFLSAAILALSSFAEETSNVNYSNTAVSPNLDLVWIFERQSFGGVEAAVITGVKTSAGENPSGSIDVPVSLIAPDGTALIVKGIDDNAFRDQIGITSVSIPVTVESIGAGVFTGCTVLAEIIVDDGNPWYRSAGGLLYDRDRTLLVACPARTEIVTLPASLERIGDEAFASCHRLSSLVIPESVTNIGDRVFSGCVRLKNLTFKGNAPSATASSFDGASAELAVYRDPETSGWDTAPWTGLNIQDATAEQPSGPESATSGHVNWTFRVIDGEAEIFGTEGDPAIPSSTVQTFSYDPENFVWIGDGALIIPSSLGGYPVTRIGEYAFAGCSALNNVVIPNGVKKIGKFAFAGCTGISSLSLPSGVREIGEHPFSGASITTLALPDSLRDLKGNPLAGCDTVLNVTLASDNSYYTVIDNVIYDKDVRKLIGCPARKESISIPSSVTEIGQEALYGCFRLRAVLLPENLATVDEGAFRDTVRLASLVFPASLRTLAGEALFDGCSALEFVGFTGDAPAADAKLFDGTSDDLLVFVTQGTKGWDGDPASSALPTKWPQDDPYGRKIYNLDVSAEAELKEGDIFTGITTNNTISYAYTLKVLADRGVEIIGISPKPIGDFTVPSDFKSSLGTLTVKSLGDRLFANSIGLLSVEIPNAVTNIGNEAFNGCNVLMEVKLNHGLRTIGRHPFEGTAIETITLPDTVSTIDGNLIYGCNPSVSLSAGENNPYFAVSAEGALYDKGFAKLYAVPMLAEEITVPATVTELAAECFAGCSLLKKVSFLGDEPTVADGDGLYADSPNVTSYANEGAGFTSGTWKNRPIVLTGGDAPSPGELSENVDGLIWHYRVIDGVAEICNDGNCAVESSDGSAILDVPLPSTLGGYVVKGIGDGALSNLRGITSVSVPDTYEWIGDSAFSNCTSLSKVNLGNGIEEIGHWPFFGTKIRTLEIPDSVNAIDGNPVAGATLATEVTVDGGNPFFAAEDGVLYDKGKKTMLACPATKTYVELPETLEAIADDALYGCNVTFGGEYPDGDLSWSYDIRDGNAVVTGISGSSETITIPETLGGFPVTEIEPDVLASLSGVKSFESESASFSTRNGVLYSADGNMLIRVPDMMTLPHSVVSEERTDQTAIMVIPDVAIENGTPVDRTVITTNVLKSSSSCATNNVAGDVSFAELLSGVSAIGDYAFTGCNMFTNTYSEITNSAGGGETGYTTSGKPYVKTIADVTVESTTYITEISLPASVHDIAPNAFASSGACVAGSSSGGTGSSTPAPSGTRLFRVTAKAISKPGYAEVYVIPSNGTDNPDETPQGIEWSNDGKEWAPAGDGVAYPVKTGKSVTIQFRSTDPRWTVPSRQSFNISESDTSVIDVTATRVSVVEAETILEPAEAKGSVSMSPKSGQVVSGKPVTLTAKPGKNTMFAYWLAGGAKIGYSTTLKYVPSEDSTVTAVFRLKSAVEDPKLDSDSIASSANAMVGVAFEASVPISDGAYPAKFSASKLPQGLKIDAANGKITGIPTKAGQYQVTISASGGATGKAKSSVTIPLSIKALPVWAQGTFTGFAAYSDDGSGTPTRLGTSSFTVSSAGKVSGKVAVGGTNWTFTATSYDASSITDVPEDAEMRFRARTDLKAGKAAAPLVLEVRMATSPSGDGETLLNAVGDGDADLGEDGIALTAWRNIWKDKATATAAKSVLAQWEGTYTVSLEDGIDYGSGYLSLTVSGKDGNVKATGKLADGTSVSVSSPLAYDGESGTYFSYLHSAPTSYKGGSFALATGFTSPRGTLQPADPILSRWTSRNPEATGVRGDGFDRAVSFTGAYYDKLEKLNSHYEVLRVSLDEGGAPELSYTYKETQKDDNGKKVTTSTAETANVADAFAQDGMKVTVNSNGVLVVAKATKPVKDAETGTWRYDGANDGALTLSFTQATGIFKGTYTFWYDYVSAYDETRDRETLSHTSKKVNFEGIMVQGEASHSGFYLWDAVGTYDDEKTGKPKTYKYKQSFPARLASE